MVDYITGVLQIAELFLSFLAGIIALSLFNISKKSKELEAWRFLIIVLLLFALEILFGALRSFGIYSNPWITHVIPSFVLLFLIMTLIKEIEYLRYWYKPCRICKMRGKK